mgnify:CR=1 FL=1
MPIQGQNFISAVNAYNNAANGKTEVGGQKADPLHQDEFADLVKGAIKEAVKIGERGENLSIGLLDAEGKKEISVLVVAVSEDPLTASDWSLLDEKIAWNAQTSDNGIEANNIWEASGGKVTFIFPAATSG